MKTQSKILILAALLLPGGMLFLLIPLAKALWRYANETYVRLAGTAHDGVGR